MHIIIKRFLYFLSALWIAIGFFYCSLWIFHGVANNDVFYATILNTALILGFVILDKFEDQLYIRLKLSSEKKKPGILKKIAIYYFTGASFKTSLYLFYFVMLICNALVSADPDFPVLRDLTDYFKTVYYGILILFAADTFLTRLLDDVQERRLEKKREILNKIKASKEQISE